MANHKSAVKRHKQSIKRNARNRAARTRIKNVVKEVRVAIASNDKAKSEEVLKSATSVVAKASGNGVVHWTKPARKISRLTKAVNGIEA